MATRNSEALASFAAYCEANPQQRFWQALRNWSQYHFIYAAEFDRDPVDTFSWEGPHRRKEIVERGERNG